MKKIPAWLLLCIIALVAGLALGVTNALTEDAIAQQAAAADDLARRTVMSAADEFAELKVADGAEGILACYEAKAGGATIGYVVKNVANGYGGAIEITVGVDLEGKVTGVSCGGSNFSETVNLGARVKEAEFTNRFVGLSAPVAIVKDGGEVDSISGASISSRAVCSGVTAACEYAAGIQ